MSHITRLKTRLTEAKYLMAALADLVHSPVAAWEETVLDDGRPEKRTVVNIKHGGRAIHFVQEDGVYAAFGPEEIVRQLERAHFFDLLAQRYAYHATIDSLQEQGFSVAEEIVEETGEMRLLLRRAV